MRLDANGGIDVGHGERAQRHGRFLCGPAFDAKGRLQAGPLDVGVRFQVRKRGVLHRLDASEGGNALNAGQILLAKACQFVFGKSPLSQEPSEDND